MLDLLEVGLILTDRISCCAQSAGDGFLFLDAVWDLEDYSIDISVVQMLDLSPLRCSVDLDSELARAEKPIQEGAVDFYRAEAGDPLIEQSRFSCLIQTHPAEKFIVERLGR